MRWDKVLEIGPFGYQIIKRFYDDIGKISDIKDPVIDTLILSTRKYLGKIFKDYELVLVQKKQNTIIKVSIINKTHIVKAIAGLKQLEVCLPGFAARAKTVIKIIEVLL